MAACGSLQHIFENPLPENPTLLESLSSSWSQIKSKNTLDDSSFTEIFGELHFKEHHSSSSSSCLSLCSSSSTSLFPVGKTNSESEIERCNKEKNLNYNDSMCFYRHSGDFSSKNSDSLSLCTEGLGFESSDDVEDLKDTDNDWQVEKERISVSRHLSSGNQGCEFKRSKLSKGSFPPPISSIGRSGKPWVCFKSYREDGRFILKEIRIPTQEFLHACREDGRLKLQFIQSDDEVSEEDEDDEEEEDENGTGDSHEVKDDDAKADEYEREDEDGTEHTRNIEK